MSGRMDRVSEEFREVVAEEIQKLKDPRVGFVTVTGVKVTPDLRRAQVFYTVLGDEGSKRATAAALKSARSRLRTAVGHQIRLKFTPELEFAEDDVAVSSRRVDKIFEEIHRREQLPANEDGDDG